MKPKLLAVDDESSVRTLLEHALGERFDVVTAATGAQGLALLEKEGPVAVIISDLEMGAMSGVEFLHEARTRSPETVRIVMTGNAGLEAAIALVNEAGLFRFLRKPVPLKTLQSTAADALKQYRLVTAERDILERTLAGMVKVLAEILSTVDPETFKCSIALRSNICSLARDLKVSNMWELAMAAMLNRIGYVAIPPTVIKKVHSRSALTPAEQELVRRVPQIGHDLLCNIPRCEGVCEIILYQAKNFDGTGYPDDSASFEAIPLGARILRIVSDLGELVWQGTNIKRALAQLRQREGVYDPAILDAAERCFASGAPEDFNTSFCTALRVKDLQVGHRLLSDIETTDGALLLQAGNLLSAPILEKVRNFQGVAKIKEPILVKGAAAA